MPRSNARRLGQGGFNEAAPSIAYCKLKNAKLVSPLYHADGCVGLSGLYSVINAIRLVVAHKHVFTAPEIHKLMSAGTRFLGGRLSPEQALLAGLRVDMWRRLAEALAETTLSCAGTWIRVERPLMTDLGRDAVFAAIEQAILTGRVPMLLCRGAWYTAVSGFTPSSLLLFDSGGACWITKRACGIPGDCVAARHVIYPTSLLNLAG